MLRMELVEKTEKKLESDLEKILSKPELTAADWDAVKKAWCIASMVEGYVEGTPVGEDGMSYGSYGMGRMHYGNQYPNQYANTMGYSSGEDYNMANGRMRSPVTGRYISNGMNNGYSGHSIEDRMIMALEQQMDAAKTDYERQIVEKEIQRLRRGDMAR